MLGKYKYKLYSSNKKLAMSWISMISCGTANYVTWSSLTFGSNETISLSNSYTSSLPE